MSCRCYGARDFLIRCHVHFLQVPEGSQHRHTTLLSKTMSPVTEHYSSLEKYLLVCYGPEEKLGAWRCSIKCLGWRCPSISGFCQTHQVIALKGKAHDGNDTFKFRPKRARRGWESCRWSRFPLPDTFLCCTNSIPQLTLWPRGWGILPRECNGFWLSCW